MTLLRQLKPILQNPTVLGVTAVINAVMFAHALNMLCPRKRP